MFRKLFESLSSKPRKPAMPMASAFHASVTIDDAKPENQPIEVNRQQVPSQSWIQHAYPLKQVVIEIHSSAQSSMSSLIDELDQVFLKLIKGEVVGEGGDGVTTHKFDYRDQVPGPSFFDEPVAYRPETPTAGQILVVRLQGTRHSNFPDINNLIASVMNEVNSKKTSGCCHDDDFGYWFTLVRAQV
ncbi:hypothetical protein PVE_R2G0085 [Pseudomonas veronii 1YdBTEX2]|uniref:Uncharacterized protein n=2 Tax=Pseudomonas veronii TaxID=76761 RepID=A0A7Y1AAI5_PSEVE|nr:hypothetical protein [Pseudomonas veronii]NMY12072.1 hypothetical protein [Pseudomonas veronii]SBW84115.1 hypothetical protein PVE_R2G0085 [Pseudomonas veronii 1YdBTEX2]